LITPSDELDIVMQICKVRTSTAAFQNHITPYPAALELMSLMGWHAVIEDLEKTWIYEHSPGGSHFMWAPSPAL
jgi:hypothetical protein